MESKCTQLFSGARGRKQRFCGLSVFGLYHQQVDQAIPRNLSFTASSSLLRLPYRVGAAQQRLNPSQYYGIACISESRMAADDARALLAQLSAGPLRGGSAVGVLR